MRTILFVHQSADLYGSDRVLLSLVTKLDRSRFCPIVLLPGTGPLLDALALGGIRTHVVPLLRVSRATLSLRGMLQLPWVSIRSLRAISDVLRGVRVDAVHSNTLAVLSGALWAKMRNIPHVWHVHEMIVHPRLVRHLFPLLLRLLSDRIVCNSGPTRQLLLESQKGLALKSQVIWNGIEHPEPGDAAQIAAFRQQLRIRPDDVLVALVGRINRLKGQGLLIEAVRRLREAGVDNIHCLIVGSAPHGQDHFEVALKAQIARYGIADRVTVMGFQRDIWRIWDACDIAVVPSTEPEAFGLVAIEAMAANKPVVAAAHGGLLEVVVHGETGLLVPPNDAVRFAEALALLAADSFRRSAMGVAGRLRYCREFSLEHSIVSFERLYESLPHGACHA